MKKIIFPIVIVALGSAIAFGVLKEESPSVVYTAPSFSSSSAAGLAKSSAPPVSSAAPVKEPIETAPDKLPPSVLIEMPFVSQAPFANWDEVHEETCEEASLLLVHGYLKGLNLTEESAEPMLQEIVKWENDTFGYYKDTTTEETGRIARELYGHSTRVIENLTQAKLEQEIAAGRPVIVPTAGQMLGNPYFSGDGPPYHMVVVLGYDSDEFITHDVGTKRGAYYHYDKDVFMAAVHDWIGSLDTITQGPKVGLVVE